MVTIKQILIKDLKDNIVKFDLILECFSAMRLQDFDGKKYWVQVNQTITFIYPNCEAQFETNDKGYRKIASRVYNGRKTPLIGGLKWQLGDTMCLDQFINKMNSLLNNPEVGTWNLQ